MISFACCAILCRRGVVSRVVVSPAPVMTRPPPQEEPATPSGPPPRVPILIVNPGMWGLHETLFVSYCVGEGAASRMSVEQCCVSLLRGGYEFQNVCLAQ